MDNVVREGTIALWLVNDNPKWLTDGHEYTFPPLTTGPVSATFKKDRDHHLRVHVTGLFEQEFRFRAHLPDRFELDPETSRPDVHVVMTWNYPTVTLHLNAKVVRQVRAH